MIPRLCRASSRLLPVTSVQYEARLTFSSSAISYVRRLPQRLVGERVNSRRAETENEGEGENSEASKREEEAAFDRWLLAGEEKVNASEIRSYKDPYGHFRKNVAPSFREPSSRNWLGRDIPFPLNPSFKPPIPLSDEFRTRLYRSFVLDPKLNSVRELARRHNISIKRVEAILRLKGMEKAWEKNKPLQNGFTKGMERLLGVTESATQIEQDVHTVESDQRDLQNRYDVEEADSQDQIEGNNRARQRYQRLFWESVAEGEEPVMPDVLQTRCGTTLSHTKFKGKTTIVERALGRPAIMFVDVGNAFVNEKEKERRDREGARRSAMKARRRTRETQST